MTSKLRADQLLVERGLFESLEKAKRFILAGKVFTKTRSVAKPSELLAPDVPLNVRGGERFVSRGGEKLDRALDFFSLDVRGMTVVDFGASTGGFTDCLLQRGSVKVFAVDVGRNQLAEKLQRDQRVVIMDKTNARYLQPQDFPGLADLVTVDVSFISLTKVLPAAYKLLRERGYIVALIKPQFEAGRREVGKGGVVKSSAIHQRVVTAIEMFAREQLGARVAGTCKSPLRGPAGNEEFFICLQKNESDPQKSS